MVSCAPNPQDCGGTGGCAGSTPELAMAYIKDHGLTTEWEYSYESYGIKPDGSKNVSKCQYEEAENPVGWAITLIIIYLVKALIR